jgi:PPOX class probable F420-dependent enzyme
MPVDAAVEDGTWGYAPGLRLARIESPEVARPLLDLARTDDAHINERLSAEPIIWLGTTRPDQRSHHVPVWFLWSDPTVLIFALPHSHKVSHIKANPAVTSNLDSAQQGADIVLARVSPSWSATARLRRPRRQPLSPSTRPC